MQPLIFSYYFIHQVKQFLIFGYFIQTLDLFYKVLEISIIYLLMLFTFKEDEEKNLRYSKSRNKRKKKRHKQNSWSKNKLKKKLKRTTQMTICWKLLKKKNYSMLMMLILKTIKNLQQTFLTLQCIVSSTASVKVINVQVLF